MEGIEEWIRQSTASHQRLLHVRQPIGKWFLTLAGTARVLIEVAGRDMISHSRANGNLKQLTTTHGEGGWGRGEAEPQAVRLSTLVGRPQPPSP